MKRFINKMPKAAPRAVARSLNKTLTMSRTRAAREVAAKRNIKIGRAKKDMRLSRASPARPTAAILASGKPIAVIEVKGAKTQTKLGVKAKITAKAKPHLFKGAFLAKMDSGHVGVFTMASKPTRISKKDPPGTKRKNLGLIEATLPSVASTMVQDETEKKLRRFAIPVYEKELIRLLELEMKKAGAR